MNENEILALFDRWNEALQTGDPKLVAALYDGTNGVLLPTVSNQVRHNHEEIEDYFVHFLAKGPKGVIDESNVRIFGDLAINSGIYTFTFANGDKVQARFTYLYKKAGDDWLIVEHHSSAMPEG
ncbi:MAG: SgcJ/EcaC family oxidoreductase [Akkermansiaceae bacterium]